jgi:hypothetical protein
MARIRNNPFLVEMVEKVPEYETSAAYCYMGKTGKVAQMSNDMFVQTIPQLCNPILSQVIQKGGQSYSFVCNG